MFSLPPAYIGDELSGVSEILDSKIGKYDFTLNGVLLSYSDIKKASKYGEIVDTEPNIRYDIKVLIILLGLTGLVYGHCNLSESWNACKRTNNLVSVFKLSHSLSISEGYISLLFCDIITTLIEDIDISKTQELEVDQVIDFVITAIKITSTDEMELRGKFS